MTDRSEKDRSQKQEARSKNAGFDIVAPVPGFPPGARLSSPVLFLKKGIYFGKSPEIFPEFFSQDSMGSC